MSALDERRYQVFVSSTFKDLESERQKVLQAVLEMSAFPAGMETFPSADDEQWEFIKREIESSDYYVVIVAGMYGSLAPDAHSYTENEYHYATSLGKPVLGFVAKDLGLIIGDRLEQDPVKKQSLLTFREKVARGKLVKFYSNADELKSQVMHALMYSFKGRPQQGWIRAKNVRRIEDLDEINKLQKQVMELQATVARLEAAQADPTAGFAQGQDIVEFEVALPTHAMSVSGAPPAPTFTFKATWDELLGMCFEDGIPEKPERAIWDALFNYATGQMRAASSTFSRWLDLSSEITESVWALLEQPLRTLRVQFLGLGLIEITSVKGGSQRWSLTEKGRLQLLATRGVSRTAK